MTVLRALRTALLAPVFVLGTLLAATTVLVISFIRRDAPLVDKVVRGWSRFFLALAGTRLATEGRENVDPRSQYVFIANHLSNLDIPVMFLATEMPIRYLAKAELFKIPVLKQAMAAIGIVRVDRIKGTAVHAEVNAGVSAARARGQSLIIFPEGTRSVTGDMATFKKGAFRIAVVNGFTIVPVTIAGTWEAWTPHSKIVRGGPVRVVIHEPVPVTGLTLTDIDGLRSRVHQVIEEEYARLRQAVVTRAD